MDISIKRRLSDMENHRLSDGSEVLKKKYWFIVVDLVSLAVWLLILFEHTGNSIEDLPLSLCRLVNLKSLALSNNNVKQVYFF